MSEEEKAEGITIVPPLPIPQPNPPVQSPPPQLSIKRVTDSVPKELQEILEQNKGSGNA